MASQKQPACLIRQSACGLQEGNPVCPKCGLDVRVGYVSKEDGQLAASRAEAQFWKNEALENKAEQAQKQAEAQAQEAERLKAEEAKRQAAKEHQERMQERQALEKKTAKQAQRQAEQERLAQMERHENKIKLSKQYYSKISKQIRYANAYALFVLSIFNCLGLAYLILKEFDIFLLLIVICAIYFSTRLWGVKIVEKPADDLFENLSEKPYNLLDDHDKWFLSEYKALINN